MRYFDRRGTRAGRQAAEKPCIKVLCLAVFVICFLSLYVPESFARKNFFIERPRLGMKLSFESEKDEREGPFTSTTEYTTTYTEELDIKTKGWVYHPALLVYTLNLSPEWEQVRDTNGDVEKTRSFLNNYLAELDFLQYKPYSLTLTGSRDTSTIRSSFAERSRSVTDLYSAVFSLKYPILPAVLSYYHQEGALTGFFDSDSTENQVSLNLRHNKYLGSSRLNLIYKDLENTIDQKLTETNHQSASLLNTYDFETDDRVTLRSDATFEETDSTDLLIRRYAIYENMNAVHTKNLETEYDATYEKDNRLDKLSLEPNRSEAKTASFGLKHRLYDNLNTYLKLRSSQSRNSAGRNSFHDASIRWDYSRDIPWGIMRTNVGYSYSIRDSKVSEEGASLAVLDEPLLFSATTNTIELDRDDILTGTIEISEKTVPNGKGIIYTEGIDYTIRTIGERTEILRRAGSSIPNDGSTLVYAHYRYIPNPAFDYELLRQDYGINLKLWNVLTLYYAYSQANQDLLRGTPPDELIDNSTHMAGADYRWRWSRTSFDWEDSYTTQSPRMKWTAREALTFTPGYRNFLQLSGSYGLAEFKDTSDIERTRTATVKFQRRLTERSNISLSGYVLDVAGQTQDFTNSEFLTEYNFYYRIYRLTLRYIFKNERDSDVDEVFRNHYFLLELRRSLF